VVGAALGVALVGSIADRGGDRVLATTLLSSAHPFWWIVIGCGIAIVALGVASTRAPRAKGEA
jgi:hypothetical protein